MVKLVMDISEISGSACFNWINGTVSNVKESTNQENFQFTNVTSISISMTVKLGKKHLKPEYKKQK